MKHTAAKRSALVLDLAALYFYKKISHGFSRQVCSRLEGCFWA